MVAFDWNGRVAELRIDFVVSSKHEGNMSTKLGSAGTRKADRSAAPQSNKNVPPLHGGGIVGIVDSPAALRKASRLWDGELDFLEWRADCLGSAIGKSNLPWIVTARHPAEGGKNAMSVSARRAALLGLIPSAAVVDIEVRSLVAMRTVAAEARQAGVSVLASFHDFQKTPALSRLCEVIRKAEELGADAIKIATCTTSPSDVACLLELFAATRLPLAVMGMGPLGMASRILFASAGSVLNYGWLDAPNVSGQWGARELAGILRQCREQDRH